MKNKELFLSIMVYIYICILCLLITACNPNNPLEQTLEQAGHNRIELEKVLEHYKNDRSKYKAACFLIEHMSKCYSYNNPIIDSLKQLKWLSTQYGEGKWTDSVVRVWTNFPYQKSQKIYDSQIITAKYLIENIDLAFDIWKRRPWAKHYSFDDFCQYILPYRISDEPLESWRKIYYDHYAATIDSTYRGNDIVEIAQAANELFLKDKFDWNTHFTLPHLGPLFLLKHHVGGCRESCDFTLYLFRALGIPTAIDSYLISPQTNGQHSWNVLKDTTGLLVPFWFMESDVKRGQNDGRPKGKVYRTMFGGKLTDVTIEYFGENKAEIEIDCPQEIKQISLCIFSCGKYKEIDKATRFGKKVIFHNLEPGVRFQPMYRKNKTLFPVGYAFSITQTGNVYLYKPNTLNKQKAILTRKYPVHAHFKEYLECMTGLIIEGDQSKNFKNPYLLGYIKDTITTNQIWFDSIPSFPIKYIRLTPPGNFHIEIGEIIFFDTNNKKLDASIYKAPLARDSKHTEKCILDGNFLSYYESKEKTKEPIILSFSQRSQIGKILFIPRNDDNFIRKGDKYELFYQNGTNGWKSLGKQIATTGELIYNNIPSGALLWLRDLTRGKEEQLFILKTNGKQYF
ncbi:hypothetical protein [Phocaeicola sp.]